MKTQADKDVFEALPCLRHDVSLATAGCVEMLGEIESFRSKLNITFGTTQKRASRIENFFDRQHRFIERLSGRFLFVNRCQFAESSLQQRQRAFLAQQIGVENANLIKRGCCGNTLLGSGTGGGDFSNHDETTVLEPARR